MIKRIQYYLLVTIISFEFLVVIASIFAIKNNAVSLEDYSKIVNLTSDTIKYLALLPVGLFVWILKEAKTLLFPEKDINKFYHAWPDYWKIKVHFYVSLFYSFLFVIMSMSHWLLAIQKESTFILMIAGIVGQGIVAASVYKAHIDLNERIVQMVQE